VRVRAATYPPTRPAGSRGLSFGARACRPSADYVRTHEDRLGPCGGRSPLDPQEAGVAVPPRRRHRRGRLSPRRRRSHASYRAVPDVAGGEHAGGGGYRQEGRPLQGPVLTGVGSGEDDSHWSRLIASGSQLVNGCAPIRMNRPAAGTSSVAPESRLRSSSCSGCPLPPPPATSQRSRHGLCCGRSRITRPARSASWPAASTPGATTGQDPRSPDQLPPERSLRSPGHPAPTPALALGTGMSCAPRRKTAHRRTVPALPG
jgi:hypothetical protein